MRKPWNANIHYHGLVFASLPPGASRVLDVGCGDGFLSKELADAGVAHVVGLDTDQPVLDRARARHPGSRVEWVLGDVLSVGFAPESFDAIVSVAALHHIDATKALTRFAHLVRPDGVVIVVGLAATAWLDVPLEATAIVVRGALGLAYGQWEHSAPQCWPPPLTYREVRTLSARLLPGVQYRRHLLGRYSLVWRRPPRLTA